MPIESALSQQRAKLKLEAMKAVLYAFNALTQPQMPDICDLLAADGSTFSFFCRPQFAADDYFISEGHSADGFYSIRSKDIHSKALASGFDYPPEEFFDITVKVTLMRSHSKKLQLEEGYRRFIDQDTIFDFMEYRSVDTFRLSFWIVRFPLPSLPVPVPECKKL